MEMTFLHSHHRYKENAFFLRVEITSDLFNKFTFSKVLKIEFSDDISLF